MDMLVSGSAVDVFNDNKFTMARIALYNTLDSNNHITDVTGTAKEHMIQTCYIRNGIPGAKRQLVADPIATTRDRITMATLLNSSSVHFNRFTDYNKFTTVFYGGWDGLNILDKDNFYMNDKASAVDTDGKAAEDYSDSGLADGNVAGTLKLNNCVFAYRTAARMMTDEMTVNTNLLAIPGIRDTLVTDVAADGAKANSMIMSIMDIPFYDEDSTRLYADSKAKPDVRETAEAFASRAVDNNYTATYFPDVVIDDKMSNRRVPVPSSVAAVAAIGFNDKVGYPWFAPAGFNRGALDIVTNTSVRLTAGDRDELYDARINPIASFPTSGARTTFVIFGQKTLQLARSALDRVNVRRMLLEVKRQVVQVANRILFEPNNAATRAKFVGQITPLLALVQSQAGIESFQIVCDDSNNTAEDVEANKLNGRIILVPTRAVEFISIDFIITNSGVSFE
jgi:phage tail sheath protein FI